MDFYKKGFLLQNRSFIKVNFSLLTLCWLLLFVPSSAICVAELPGSADAGKFRPDSKRGIKPEEQQSSKKLPEIIKKESKKPVTTEEANDFRFFLSRLFSGFQKWTKKMSKNQNLMNFTPKNHRL